MVGAVRSPTISLQRQGSLRFLAKVTVVQWKRERSTSASKDALVMSPLTAEVHAAVRAAHHAIGASPGPSCAAGNGA